MNQMTKVAAVSLIALPIGFASLSTLWFTRKRKQQEQEHETQKSPTNLEKYLEFEKNITFYDTHGYRNIWKTYEGIFVILKSAKNLLSELLSQEDFNKFDLLLNKIYEKQLHRINYLNHLPKILILEGLQHCGMKTLQQNLMKSSSQIRLCPDLEEYLQILLIKLKQYPLSLLHAFQLFCDYYRYHLAEELSIKDSCYVLLNRFYHTTCVNQIISSFSKNINEIQLENIPSYAFQWPRDLPYPLLTIYLVVSPEEKIRRNNQLDYDQYESLRQSLYSMIEGPPIIAIDASGDPLTVLETLYQCYESQSLYLRSYTASISPHSAGASASDPLALALPDEDSLTLIDCYGEQYNRRYSMKDFTLEDHDEDLEGAIRPFSLKYKNRMSLSNDLPVRGSRRQSSDERKRESLGVYGAIMQVNWEE